MQYLTTATVQPAPSPAPREREPVSGWGIVGAVVAVAVTIYIITKIINNAFGTGGPTDKSGGWR